MLVAAIAAGIVLGALLLIALAYVGAVLLGLVA